MELVVPTAEQKKDPIWQLKRLEARIRDSDQAGLKARWDSGRKLRELRETEYLMTLEDIAAELGASASELGFRIRFAETEEALTTASNRGWSWYEVHQHMTELVGRKRATRKTKRSVVVKELSLMLRRVRTGLKKAHASDLTEADLKLLDILQEEIARIYDELGAKDA